MDISLCCFIAVAMFTAGLAVICICVVTAYIQESWRTNKLMFAYLSLSAVFGIALVLAPVLGFSCSETDVDEREVTESSKIAAFEQNATSQHLDIDTWSFVAYSETDVTADAEDAYVVMVDPDGTGSYVRKEYPVDETRIAFDATVDTARVETVRTTTAVYDGTFLWFDVHGDDHRDETVIHIPEGTMETLSENAASSGSEAD